MAGAPGDPARHRTRPAHLAPAGGHRLLSAGRPGRGTYLGYRASAAVAPALPGRAVPLVARVAGVTLAAAMKDRRAIAERHLRRVHGPHVRGRHLEREVVKVFASYARYWIESARLVGMAPAELAAGMSCTGLEHVERAVAEGRGAILALPHLGNWEFGGAWISSMGYPLMVVAEPLQPPELFEWFSRLRGEIGLDVVPLGPSAAGRVLGRLRAGGVVALVCDRDLVGTGVEVEFFAERTTLPGGPATLALRSGADLLPTAVYFDGPRRHRALVGPPLPIERRGNFREDVARVTQALAVELEELVRRAPDQWHLLQPNWPSDRVPVA